MEKRKILECGIDRRGTVGAERNMLHPEVTYIIPSEFEKLDDTSEGILYAWLD
jgi:hypothetical protein